MRSLCRRLLLPPCVKCNIVKSLRWYPGLVSAAGLSSLTSLSLKYVGGQVLPPDGSYISQLRALCIEGDQAAQVSCARCWQVHLQQQLLERWQWAQSQPSLRLLTSLPALAAMHLRPAAAPWPVGCHFLPGRTALCILPSFMRSVKNWIDQRRTDRSKTLVQNAQWPNHEHLVLAHGSPCLLSAPRLAAPCCCRPVPAAACQPLAAACLPACLPAILQPA